MDNLQMYTRALFEGLSHIHKHGIIHRDLKPSNFIHKFGTNQYMLVDFGLIDTKPGNQTSSSSSQLSRVFTETKTGQRQTLPGAPRAGTRGFRAPEVLMRYRQQTSAIDIWSAGIILLSIMCSRHPITYPMDDIQSLLYISELVGSQQLVRAANAIGRHLRLPQDCEFLGWRTIVKKMRPSSDKREWSDQLYKFIHRCLDPNPLTRLTADEALLHPFLILKDF